MARNTETYRDAAGRVVGKRFGRTFVRGAHDHHFLKRPPAVSLDAAVCERVFRECSALQVINLDTGAIYGISVDEFRDNMRTLDRGFGEQYMVPLSYWRLLARPIGSEAEPGPTAAEAAGNENQPRLM